MRAAPRPGPPRRIARCAAMKMILPFAAILLAGLLTALEGATNGWVTKESGSLYVAMAAAFGLSSLLLLGAALFVPIRPSWAGVAGLP